MFLFSYPKQGFFIPFLVYSFFCVSCGTIANQSPSDEANSNTNLLSTLDVDSYAFGFATDYLSSGQLYLFTLDESTTQIKNTQIQELGSSALVREFENKLFLLHDGFSFVSSNNLQIIDPQKNFITLAQWTTGSGTNPHDVVVTGSRAFISLYNPTADSDADGLPNSHGDVIEMNIENGQITNRYSFKDYLNVDDVQSACADQMLLVNEKLYVLLQDLNTQTFEADTQGKLAIIDISTQTIDQVITLQGRNPTSLALSDDKTHLYISHMASFDYTTLSYNIEPSFGGIEIFDLSTQSTIDFIADDTMGGYVERVVAGDGSIYALVSSHSDDIYSSQVIRFSQNRDAEQTYEIFDNAGTDIRAIHYQNHYLWISRRDLETQTSEIEVYSLVSNDILGDTLFPIAPVMSLTGQSL